MGKHTEGRLTAGRLTAGKYTAAKRRHYLKNRIKMIRRAIKWRKDNIERLTKATECLICGAIVQRQNLKKHQRSKYCQEMR